MIDLHLHTTASDGRCTPAELVRRAREAGITTLSVTDHDTVAGLAEAAAAADAAGIGFVPGIEITAVWNGADVHVLGYFFDPNAAALATFLTAQRADRVRRAHAIAARLAELGVPIDIAAVVREAEAERGRSLGRPLIARALVRAGHVADVPEAFERWIGEGCRAFVPRRGASPAEVVGMINDAGGIASLAHPGLLQRDVLIPGLVGAGLAALEAYHSDHTQEMTDRYRRVAAEYGLALSGGSDYHADAGHRKACLGQVGVSEDEFDRLRARHEASIGGL